MADLALNERDGLPDALRVLLEEYPRSGWTQDPNFDGLIRFWLERHMMFREVLTTMTKATQGVLDAAADPARFRAETSRYGGFFVNQLHHHHQIEDVHYFPKLQGKDARVARGFDILDADHHAIDGYLAAFVEAANGVLQAEDGPAFRDAAAAHLTELQRLDGLLDRHLTDEEELVVPVILKYGADLEG